MLSPIKSKRGAFDNPVVTLAIALVALLILAPVILKIVNSVSTGFSNGLGNMTGGGGTLAKANFDYITGKYLNFFDKIVLAIFISLILLDFISAFFIDASGFFVIIYILSNLFLVLFAPAFISVADTIYNSSQFTNEVALLSFVDTIRNNFTVFMIGVMVITGIIIYGKVVLFGGSKTRK